MVLASPPPSNFDSMHMPVDNTWRDTTAASKAWEALKIKQAQQRTKWASEREAGK